MRQAALTGLGNESWVVTSNTSGLAADSIAISGGKNARRGTIYGVYGLLKSWGYTFFAPTETVMPSATALAAVAALPINLTFTPAMEYVTSRRVFLPTALRNIATSSICAGAWNGLFCCRLLMSICHVHDPTALTDCTTLVRLHLLYFYPQVPHDGNVRDQRRRGPFAYLGAPQPQRRLHRPTGRRLHDVRRTPRQRSYQLRAARRYGSKEAAA